MYTQPNTTQKTQVCSRTRNSKQSSSLLKTLSSARIVAQLIRMELKVTSHTTTLSYWLNWRVLLCAIWVLTSIIISLLLIWKYETSSDHTGREQSHAHFLSTWRPCLRQIHPIWLLVFRVTAFCLLLATLIIKLVWNGGVMFYYYSQWTFTLLTIYFGFGSLLSIFGCYWYHKRSGRGFDVHHKERDAEYGPCEPLIKQNGNMYRVEKATSSSEAAGFQSYLFQVMFQINAGAVMLTDGVYWFIIFPFLTIKDYDLNLMTVNIHTINAVLFFVDTILNSMPMPWFGISYFVLWTSVYVIFQWGIHACESIWWPYPYIDLSSTYSPLWYLLVGLMHIPCYGIFVLIVQMKHYLLSRWFPNSYQW